MIFTNTFLRWGLKGYFGNLLPPLMCVIKFCFGGNYAKMAFAKYKMHNWEGHKL